MVLIEGGVSAYEKNNTAWQGLYRGLLQTVIKALDAKRSEPAHPQGFFLDKLLAVGLGVFNLIKAGFRDFHHCVFSSPLPETKIVEIDESANGKGHFLKKCYRIWAPNDFFMGRYQRWSTL